MSFPLFSGKHALPAMINPQDIVAYRAQLGRAPKVTELQGVLLCVERGLPHRLRRKIPIQTVGHMNGVLYGVKQTRNKVAVMAEFGGGAPTVAGLADEFAALGARRMIVLTGGGALQPDLKIGDIVVCSQALRDEGASYHYLPPARSVEADAGLVDRLVIAIEARGSQPSLGTTWTTDAGYRETFAEVSQYRSEGVKTVEMECAALFAIGQSRGVQTAAVVVVMDSLAGERWQIPQRLDAVQRALDLAYAAAIDALSG